MRCSSRCLGHRCSITATRLERVKIFIWATAMGSGRPCIGARTRMPVSRARIRKAFICPLSSTRNIITRPSTSSPSNAIRIPCFGGQNESSRCDRNGTLLAKAPLNSCIPRTERSWLMSAASSRNAFWWWRISRDLFNPSNWTFPLSNKWRRSKFLVEQNSRPLGKNLTF